MISVLLVDDSLLVLQILRRMLSSPDSGIEVVGTASNGVDALDKVAELNPQVICTDYHMPLMDGLEFTREVMARYPRPILVISIAVQKGKDDTNIFQFLEAGAVDIFPKPVGGLKCDFEKLSSQLNRKIRVLSGVTMFTRAARSPDPGTRNDPAKHTTEGTTLFAGRIDRGAPQIAKKAMLDRSAQVLAIGASTGGPQAIHDILCVLPPTLPMPVICIQHISEGFLQGLIDWLGSQCALPVQIAVHGDFPTPGTVYFPPEHRQLTIDRQGRFNTSTVAPDEPHVPSVTVTFNSLAQYYRKSVIGVLLTGMGDDGAIGLKNIHSAGGYTIAEDKSSCVVFGMPNEAIKLGAATEVLPLPKIVGALGALK